MQFGEFSLAYPLVAVACKGSYFIRDETSGRDNFLFINAFVDEKILMWDSILTGN